MNEVKEDGECVHMHSNCIESIKVKFLASNVQILFIIELLMLKLCYRTQTMFSSCKVADVMIGSG